MSVAGERAGLSGERSGLFYEATRIVNEFRPMFAIWENVPGLLSSDEGRDLARVLREMDRIGYNGAWRVFDSQYFGVAQRRRRLFGVFTCGSFGAGGCAGILSIASGMCGHPPPSRESGGGVTPYTATGFRRYSEGVGTLKASGGHAGGGSETIIVKTANTKARGKNVSTKGISYTLDGAPNQSVVFQQNCRGEVRLIGGDSNIAGALVAQPGMKQQNFIAFDMSHADDPVRFMRDVSNTLQARMGTGGNQVPCVCLMDQGGSFMNISYNVTGSLRAQSKSHMPTVPVGNRARRFTPKECERLQGFPDDWSKGFSDSARYKMLGNAVTVNVVEWIAKRVVKKWKEVTSD